MTTPNHTPPAATSTADAVNLPANDPATRPIRHAAVALILYEREGRPWAIFTRRTESVADHKGQICLPGGSRDPEDATLLATALRETEEELGIEPELLRPVAALEPVYTVGSRYYIHPFVFYTPERPTMRPEDAEVAEIIDIPIAAFLPAGVCRVERWDTHGVARDVYFYECGTYTIWGATGRVLKHFLDGYSAAWWESARQGKTRMALADDGDRSGTIPV